MKSIIKLFLLLITCMYALNAQKLTTTEKEYIKNNTIKIGMVKEYYPFSFKQNGKINGFSYEYFKLLASKVNLKYEIDINNWSTTLENFKNKKIDVIDAISYTKEREAFTTFTEPYFSIPNVIFAQKDSIKNYKGLESLKGKKIGITKGIYYYENIKNLDLFELVAFENSREKIKALAFGNIDAAFNNLTSGQKYILQGAYTNLEVLDEISENIIKKEDLRLGITKENTILYSIIQKATALITPSEKLQLINKYFAPQKKVIQNALINLTKKEKQWLKDNPTVTIAQMIKFPPFSFEENGKNIGYEIDLLNLISQKSGLEFKIISGNWSDNLDSFKSKKVDMISSISYKKEREDFTLFTDSYYEIPNVIFVRDDFKNYKGIQSLKGKKVGIVQDVFYEEELRKFGYLNIIEYKSEVDLAKALVFNQIDATIGSLTTMNDIIKKNLYSNIKLVDELLLPNISKNDLHFGVNPQKPILYTIIKKALTSINESEKIEMLNRWINVKTSIDQINTNSKLLLTKDEQNYLQSKNNVITMCIDPNWMPLEAFDKTGKHIGMTADYYKVISSRLGVNFKVIKSDTWTQSLDFAQNRQCDILSLVMQTPDRSKYLNFTAPYLSIPLVVATKFDVTFINDINELTGKRVAIPKGYAFAELTRNKYPKIQIIDVENIHEGLKGLSENKYDAYIGTLTSIGQVIQKEYLGELKITGKVKDNWELGIGVRNDDEVLLNILQKAINSLTQETRNEILNKWVSVKYDRAVDYTLLWYVLIGSTVIIAILLYRQYYINKLNTQLKQISITDGLTNIYNRRYFNELFPKIINSAKRKNELLSFVIIDIDYFKKCNDTYGHQKGDTVLKSVATCIKDSLHRADDYCFRLGGEEFGVIFKADNKEKAIQFANTIRQNIENLQIEHTSNSASKYITASIGLVCKNASKIKDDDSIYKEADELLYKAKEKGRNRVEYK